jgi:hypothetical protein
MLKTQKQNSLSINNNLILRILLFTVLFAIISSALSAQKIEIYADQKPLNEVFFQLIEDFNIQLSYNDRQLSRERVTIQQSFPTTDDALKYLLEDLPYTFELKHGIYIVFKKKPQLYTLNGRILANDTHETLPFSHIIANQHGLISDVEGRFFLQSQDSVFDLTISYLGYYILDTTLRVQDEHNIYLIPSYTNLKEVIIKGKVVETSSEIGDSPGKIRLNHATAKKLPGNGDNSVFNFLRLKPGILAAGEQSSDLIIWGGYEGHSKVLFDGFTLFGLKNFNDNIGAVNPYMVKDIVVLKGAYGAEYGERVGGIVDITGIGGDKLSPNLNMNINNMTMSAMASLPINKESALMLAFRRTYYNLYDPEDINVPFLQGNQRQADITAYPDYTFGDFNLKYAGSSAKNGDYFISLYQGKDNFSYTVDQQRTNVLVHQEATEESRQRGGSLNWSKQWKNGLNSTISSSYSDFNRELLKSDEVIRIINNQNVFTRENNTSNGVNEATLHSHLSMPAFGGKCSWGLEYKYNSIGYEEIIDAEDPYLIQANSGRMNAFVAQRSVVSEKFIIEPGLRVDYPIKMAQLYFQPRLSVTAELTEDWKIYAAWGIYNQFISQASVLDDYGNYQYFWALSDNFDVPVLHSVHNVGGISYHKDELTISAEGYYKTTHGLTRYVNLLRENIKDVFEGNSRSFGMDLFIKRKFRKHEGWVSYSLSKTEEDFDYFLVQIYRDAPHDQRHEIKTAILFNFSPLYISANYIYGSGFINRTALNQVAGQERYPYSRLDAAIIYRFGLNNYNFEAGISVLNIFNTENIKYSNFVRLPSDQLTSINIHAEAVPFTPAIYLNLSF